MAFEGEFNDIYTASNILLFVFFENVCREKNYVADNLAKQGNYRLADLVAWLSYNLDNYLVWEGFASINSQQSTFFVFSSMFSHVLIGSNCWLLKSMVFLKKKKEHQRKKKEEAKPNKH